MFDIGWTELVIIAVVAIVVVGPKDLPRAMRTVGKWSGKMKRMAREFQNQFNEAIRESELEDVKKEVASIARIDPMADLKKDLAKAEAGIRSDLAKPANGAANGAAPPADSELAQLTADKGSEEPAPAAIEPKPHETPAPEPVGAVAAEKTP
jgi:sec-independent protein translocase protein TatB